MQFKCNCNVCQEVFGNSLHALPMPQDELEISLTLSHYFIIGGSGNKLHYNFVQHEVPSFTTSQIF